MFNRTRSVIGSIGSRLWSLTAPGGKSENSKPGFRVPTSAEARLRYIRNRSKYAPHQGAREIERRRQQFRRACILAIVRAERAGSIFNAN